MEDILEELTGYQRIARRELWESREIAVGGPEFVDPVVQAKGSDAGVVNAGPLQFGFRGKVAEPRQVSVAFGYDLEIVSGKPCVDTGKCGVQWCWNFEDFRICNDGDEFMDAWPWDRPFRRTFPEFFDKLFRVCVKGAFLAVGVNEDVRINCDHAPCLW